MSIIKLSDELRQGVEGLVYLIELNNQNNDTICEDIKKETKKELKFSLRKWIKYHLNTK